jgi:hypothetical protein
MFEKKSAEIVFGAINLISVGMPLLASQDLHASVTESQMTQINSATIKSIESTWLKVPKICKARHFNASPVSLQTQQMASSIQSIYSLFHV